MRYVKQLTLKAVVVIDVLDHNFNQNLVNDSKKRFQNEELILISSHYDNAIVASKMK